MRHDDGEESVNGQETFNAYDNLHQVDVVKGKVVTEGARNRVRGVECDGGEDGKECGTVENV